MTPQKTKPSEKLDKVIRPSAKNIEQKMEITCNWLLYHPLRKTIIAIHMSFSDGRFIITKIKTIYIFIINITSKSQLQINHHQL